MIVNTNEVIYDDGRESSIIHFSNNVIHATIHILVRSHRIIFSWVLIYQKKRTSSNGSFLSSCQILMRLIVRRHCSWKKKERNFHAKRHTFWRTRARERVHIYTEVDKMSGNTDVEKGNFAVKAGLAQVRDSHPRELARFSSVDGFSFLLRRRRHRLSPFSWRLSSSSVLHFFSSYDDSYKSSQQREFKRKKSVDDDR